MLMFPWCGRYTFGFDACREYVSVRPESMPPQLSIAQRDTPSRAPIKEDKIDEFKWYQRPVLSIEDPFEVNYNVAHVLRDGSFKRMRAEFAVSTGFGAVV